MTYIPDSGQSVQSTTNTNSNIIIGGQTTLAADITDSDTTITLATGTGSNFPASDSIIQIGSEIIKYSSRSGDVLTIAGAYGERGAYNTTATSHTTGATINGTWVTEGELNGYPAAITSTRMNVTYTLYYDFSNDGTIWTTYPTSGFTGATNIHEFHQAIKAGRYFRPRILNTSASASSSSWHYTYYGQFSDGKLPLNQTIGNDQDSIIVRGVNVGADPKGTFVNQKTDGYVFGPETTNLAGTTLTTGISAGQTGNITVGSTTDFTDSGYIIMGSEILQYDSKVNATTLNITARGVFNTTASAYSASENLGQVYQSGVLDLTGYSQAQNELYSNLNGRLFGFWYSDSAGSNFVEPFTIPITAGKSFSATFPTRGSYLRYAFGNLGGATQTQFNFGLKLLTKSISGQTLEVNDTVTSNMVCNLGRNVIVGETDNGTFENVLTTNSNELRVSTGERDLFGINISKQIIPLVQSYQLYGISSHSQLYEQFTASGGTITATADGTGVDLNISTTLGSYSTLRSKRVLKYRSGYSLLCRSGFKFDTPVAGSLQFTGVGNAQSDLYFCYNGTDFGIRRSTGGQLEVRKLSMSAASSGTESISIVLNSATAVTFNVSNAGGVIAFTAHEIENNTYSGWNIEHIGNDVFFIASSVGARNGTYTFTNNTAGTATGTFSQIRAGSDLTTTFVAQSAWNGWSDMITSLDPTQNNMYQILYSWYGVGNIIFSIYNPSTSRYETVHTLTFANTETSPSLTSPNMYIQRGVASLTSTTAMTAKSYGSFGGIIGNIDKSIGPKSSVSNTKPSITTETIVLAVKNRAVINGYSNQSEAFLKSISASTEGTKNVIFKVYKNPSSLGNNSTTNYTNYSYVEESESLLLLDTTVGTFLGGDILFTFTLAKADSRYFDISERGIFLGRDDVLIITATSTSATEATVSLAFEEDY